MSAEAPEILRLEGISRNYGGSQVVAALSGIDLSVRAGEFIAIVGKSGSGKSTLLNMLGLLDTPSSGNYSVDGVLIDNLAERDRDELRARTFGFVFQDSHMLLKETAAKNAALGLFINRIEPSQRSDIVAEALAEVEMRDKAQQLARNLSGGERQRVAIARAIATSPRILLADEPTGALDSINSGRIIQAFRALNQSGVTVVLITHDPEIAATADRVVTLSDGRVASDRVSSQTEPRASSGRPQRHIRPLASNTQGPGSRVSERVLSAISNHTLHVARAALLLIAFTVGAAGLVLATALSQTAAGQITSRFESAELGEFYVIPKGSSENIRSELGLGPAASNTEVASLVSQRLRGQPAVGDIGLIAEANFDGQVTLLNPAMVQEQPRTAAKSFVVDSTFLQMQRVSVAGLPPETAPRLFSPEQEHPGVLLGGDLAQKLGLAAAQPGSQLWIEETPVAVLGVIDDYGEEPQFATAIVANAPLSGLLATPDFSLLVAVEPGTAASVATVVGDVVAPGDPQLFLAETAADLSSLKRGVSADLVSLVNLIAWILLALSSLSAATAAYLSVHARSSEIALRRAAGESRRSVWLQFVLEGLTIGALGGVLGSAIGVVLSVTISLAQEWDPAFSMGIVALGVAIGAVTGVIASLYPAAVAARQDPALAVRGS